MTLAERLYIQSHLYTISVGEVTALNHELLDDSVKGRAFITKPLLSRGQCTEILRSLGHSLAIETHYNPSNWLIAVRDVEVDLISDLRTFCGFRGLSKEKKARGYD